MGAPSEIVALVDRFHRQYDSYRLPSYNETQLRREFVDPFFKALGWDVDNRQGYAEAYKDVIHEDAIKIGGSTKAPDYSLRVGGVRKFFVETKKPAVNIAHDPSPAFQLRRYAWSAKLPLSILTDFEEFAVYDCRVRPEKNDQASKARILYFNYQQYDEHWEEIASIFSRDAVLKGSFDKYAVSTKRKRGTAEVDDAFLGEIEQWRTDLARNLALRNTELTQREINFAVQKTIDRLIFLRICEDRGIELYGGLQSLLNGPKAYARLCELFRRADERYNSGLFHFSPERDRAEPPDEWTLSLAIDDRVLKEIIGKLYYPESPYEFSVLGADILGQVYEQFLGKVIRLTKGHQAKVEDKPEVKKAGGVYYTPTYIVDYIVQNTVGKLLEGQTPHEVAGRTKTWKPKKNARPLSVLDPACGSGSFLIGAYQYLLDWYRDWYVEHGPKRFKDRIYQTRHDQWRLTTAERKRILLDHIYGVDIDSQAVEVTKLSLLLKVLEGETKETLQRQLFTKERALPDLADNIKCGNSLIGPDFYQGKQLDLFDEDERLRINVFDWQAEFPHIFARSNPLQRVKQKGKSPPEGGHYEHSGGFDAVIGNPPYIRIQTLKQWIPEEADFFKARYLAAASGNYDIYVLFVERGLELLNRDGRLGFILPHKFFNAKYGQGLRTLIGEGRHLAHVVHFGDQQVFANATTYTCLIFLNKSRCDECRIMRVADLETWRSDATAEHGTVLAIQITSDEWNFAVGEGRELFHRLREFPVKLGDLANRIAQGIRTSANEVYVLDVLSNSGELIEAHSAHLNQTVELERSSVKLFLLGREIKPYRVAPSGKAVLMPYQFEGRRARLIPSGKMQDLHSKAWEYLSTNKSYLQDREQGRFRGSNWYMYGRQQNIDLMLLPKILVPDIADRASFALDEAGEYAFTSGYGITFDEHIQESPKYILGLLNSRVLDFYLKKVSTTLRGGFFRYFTQYLEQLPIRCIDFDNAEDTTRHKRVVGLVNHMLSLQKTVQSARAAHERTAIERQITATDREIDRLVYELYGLSEEEIRIVEEATA